MTVARQTRSWQNYPVGKPSPPPCCKAAPSLFPLRDWLIATHGGKSLSVDNLWHDRPVRGGSKPSSHRGAAFDWRYANPGKGRTYMLNNVLPLLINESYGLNVQQIHDYVGCRVWKASRSQDANGGWARQNDGSHSGMMGASWAEWLHIEAGEWFWNDGRPIETKLGGTPPPPGGGGGDTFTLELQKNTLTPAKRDQLRGNGDVYLIQQIAMGHFAQLGNERYNCGPPDGDYGPKTQDAVKQIQADGGLAQDAMCGPATWGYILNKTGG